MKLNDHIQNYLSLGYLFLLILGIIKDAVFYGFLGVNILDYANFSDILISPVAFLAKSWIVPFAVALMIYFFFLTEKLKAKLQPKYGEKKWYKKLFNIQDKPEKEEEDNQMKFIGFTVVMLACFYLGAGIGGGTSTAKKMANDSFKMKDKIVFVDAETIQTSIIGRNSEYIFYVRKGSKELSISPIKGVIREIVEH